MRSTKFWILLIAAALAVCLAAAAAVMLGNTGSCVARVYQNGQLLRAIDLSQVEEGYTFTVSGPAGENLVQVEPGRIRVAAADCPDQVCVHQGWISTGIAPIVCLPNQLVIQIQSDSHNQQVDGVTG